MAVSLAKITGGDAAKIIQAAREVGASRGESHGIHAATFGGVVEPDTPDMPASFATMAGGTDVRRVYGDAYREAARKAYRANF
jgi:hypothetical protein